MPEVVLLRLDEGRKDRMIIPDVSSSSSPAGYSVFSLSSGSCVNCVMISLISWDEAAVWKESDDVGRDG